MTADVEVGERLAGTDRQPADITQSPRQQCAPGTRYVLISLHTGARFALRTGINTIGRYQENDIVLDLPAVSRRHCVILVHASGGCEVHDTASRNGTFVNRVLVRAAWVWPGSLIQITANKFVLQIDEVAHHLAKAPPVDPSTSFCTVIM